MTIWHLEVINMGELSWFWPDRVKMNRRVALPVNTKTYITVVYQSMLIGKEMKLGSKISFINDLLFMIPVVKFAFSWRQESCAIWLESTKYSRLQVSSGCLVIQIVPLHNEYLDNNMTFRKLYMQSSILIKESFWRYWKKWKNFYSNFRTTIIALFKTHHWNRVPVNISNRTTKQNEL